MQIQAEPPLRPHFKDLRRMIDRSNALYKRVGEILLKVYHQ